MQIQPLSDRVLLKPLEPENVTKSGIYLPESANKERSSLYEVIAVGPGKEVEGKKTPIDLKSGDIVLSGQYSGDDIEFKQELMYGAVQIVPGKYKIVGVEYILARVTY